MNNEVIVELKDISKKFQNITALNKISFEIFKGELFGLVGPDGSGKTTLMKILCGVENKDDGILKIFNLDSDRARNEINKKLGYLSQRFSLYGDLTINENIEFFARIHGIKDFQKRKNDLLEFTRLTKFQNRLVDKLSGGMKQKTALACALIHSPEILILDEPTNGVDPVSRRDFWSILAELQKQRITIIISTPYLDEIERCNRVAIFSKGNLIAVDSPAQFKRILQTKVYEIICNPVRKAYQIIQTNYPNVEVQMFGDNINVLTESTFDDLISKLNENDIEIIEVKEKIPSMENVFIHLVKEL